MSAASGWWPSWPAQEFQWVFSATKKTGGGGGTWFDWNKTERRVGTFYFYIHDPEIRTRLHQDLHLLPLSGQGVDQRARVGQAPGRPGTPEPHRPCQRVCRLHQTRTPPGHLRRLRTRRCPGVLRPLDHPDPQPLQRGGPGRGVLVGALHAPGRGVEDAGLRRSTSGPGVLRGPRRGQRRRSGVPKRWPSSSPARCARPPRSPSRPGSSARGPRSRWTFVTSTAGSSST